LVLLDTVPRMPRASFQQKTETFGLDAAEPWALPALRLLFSVPRVYAPLASAWEQRHPGTMKALNRLVQRGFVEYQDPVIIDTRTGAVAAKQSPALPRYRTTSKGHRFNLDVQADIRVLNDAFPRLTPTSLAKVAKLIDTLDLDGTHARYGLSAPHVTALSLLPDRSARWWIRRLVADGYLRELTSRHPDIREVVPAHWRPTRLLARQLSDVLESSPVGPSLRSEFRLGRSRYLGDIDPVRVGISGATDFDHDVETQRVLAAMLKSERCPIDAAFAVEPRILLPIDGRARPWQFSAGGNDTIFYQPDAELRERDNGNILWSVLEYERYQNRRDAWSHVERFLGWVHLRALPFEGAVLRFVVDSESRVRSYVALIEAFADYALDHPDEMPSNSVTLAVSSVERILGASDPLDPRAWFRIQLPSSASESRCPVLHDPKVSPYNEYFGRGGS
jgi:hypothetical protein